MNNKANYLSIRHTKTKFMSGGHAFLEFNDEDFYWLSVWFRVGSCGSEWFRWVSSGSQLTRSPHQHMVDGRETVGDDGEMGWYSQEKVFAMIAHCRTLKQRKTKFWSLWSLDVWTVPQQSIQKGPQQVWGDSSEILQRFFRGRAGRLNRAHTAAIRHPVPIAPKV